MEVAGDCEGRWIAGAEVLAGKMGVRVRGQGQRSGSEHYGGGAGAGRGALNTGVPLLVACELFCAVSSANR